MLELMMLEFLKVVSLHLIICIQITINIHPLKLCHFGTCHFIFPRVVLVIHLVRWFIHLPLLMWQFALVTKHHVTSYHVAKAYVIRSHKVTLKLNSLPHTWHIPMRNISHCGTCHFIHFHSQSMVIHMARCMDIN
jgi:hypothetical protein